MVYRWKMTAAISTREIAGTRCTTRSPRRHYSKVLPEYLWWPGKKITVLLNWEFRLGRFSGKYQMSLKKNLPTMVPHS
jgi:hypothetical protein